MSVQKMQEIQFLPLGQEDSPRVGNGKLQYSCLYNPIDSGAWRAAENGVTKSWTRLSNMAQLTSKRSQSEKATDCRTPTVWQSREGSAETKKGRWWLGLGREEGIIEHRGILGQWKYPVWHHRGGFMSLYICLNS